MVAEDGADRPMPVEGGADVAPSDGEAEHFTPDGDGAESRPREGDGVEDATPTPPTATRPLSEATPVRDTSPSPRVDFSALAPDEFEGLIVDILSQLGFVNIEWHKGTPRASSPADDGRDITATKPERDADDHRYEQRWLVDAKHDREKAVPKEELMGLLAAGQAKGADVILYVASGYLSTSAHRFLREWQATNRPPFRLRVWERHDLENLPLDWDILAARHNIGVGRGRTKTEIEKVARQMSDLVWYDETARSLDLQGADEVKDALAREALRSQMRDIETRYPGAELPPWPEDARRAIEGRLAALNWVLGGKWNEERP